MNKLKVGIVEDEMIIAEALSEILKTCGYEVTEPVSRYSEAIDMIESEKPDLLLLDINLAGKLDGIDLARTIQENFNIPYIFLTANTDAGTIDRAKLVRPSAYLAKPISKEQLYSAIEIAMSNYHVSGKATAAASGMEMAPRDVVFVKDGYSFRKVQLKEINYVESEANYVTLHINDGSKLMVRSTLNEYAGHLDRNTFVRVHRSYVVNINHIDGVYPSELVIKGHKIPVSRNYRDDLLKVLGIAS